MNPPLIFFHAGFDPYLLFTLAQARRSNPHARIILLGDERNRVSAFGVEHFGFRDYAARRDEFVSFYQHFSPHDVSFERICLERWFYLTAFLEQERLEDCCYFDSDVLLFAEIARLVPDWAGFDVAGAPHFFGTCYVRRRRIIADFCDFIAGRYRDPEQVKFWAANYAAPPDRCPAPYGRTINDIVLSWMFATTSRLPILDLLQPRNGWVFDANLTALDTFEPRGECKQLYQDKPGGPVEAVKDGRRVRMASVHFGGHTKRFMSGLTGWSGTSASSFLRPNYRRNFKKLIQHFYFGKQFRRGVRPLNG